MKNPVKALNLLNGKKRYIAAAIIAAELLSLPAAAHIIHRVATDTRPHVVAVEVPTSKRGLTRFLVTANEGFEISASNLAGSVEVKVRKSGTMPGGQRFGDAAQLPGAQSFCAESLPDYESPIYVATDGTALEDGKVVDQAVIFEFRYDTEAQPNFKFTPDQDLSTNPTPCSIEIG